jgi:hypothetical protein
MESLQQTKQQYTIHHSSAEYVAWKLDETRSVSTPIPIFAQQKHSGQVTSMKVYDKTTKCMKLPRRWSQAVNRRADNTMAKRKRQKDKRTNNYLQNTKQKANNWATRILYKQVLKNGKRASIALICKIKM